MPSHDPSLYLYLLTYTMQYRNQSHHNLAGYIEQAQTQKLRSMATLQRSAKSFRRQGSSGQVWDDSLLSDQLYEGAKNDRSDLKELRPCQSAKAIFVGVDFSSGPNNAAPPATSPRSQSSAGKNPSQREYTRSLSGVIGKQYLVNKLKMGQCQDKE